MHYIFFPLLSFNFFLNWNFLLKFDFKEILAMRFLLRNEEDLKLIAQSIIDHTGEGLIMRQVGSKYEHGRSLSLLKFKVYFLSLLLSVSRIYSFF
jgi:ATP-dependent DNA ligase